MIYNLSLEGFQRQKKHGVYIFESPGCFTCSYHIEEFAKHFSEFYIISTLEDPAYFESIEIGITPTTRIYKNDKLIWTKEGVLYDTQLDEMRKFL